MIGTTIEFKLDERFETGVIRDKVRVLSLTDKPIDKYLVERQGEDVFGLLVLVSPGFVVKTVPDAT